MGSLDDMCNTEAGCCRLKVGFGLPCIIMIFPCWKSGYQRGVCCQYMCESSNVSVVTRNLWLIHFDGKTVPLHSFFCVMVGNTGVVITSSHTTSSISSLIARPFSDHGHSVAGRGHSSAAVAASAAAPAHLGPALWHPTAPGPAAPRRYSAALGPSAAAGRRAVPGRRAGAAGAAGRGRSSAGAAAGAGASAGTAALQRAAAAHSRRRPAGHAAAAGRSAAAQLQPAAAQLRPADAARRDLRRRWSCRRTGAATCGRPQHLQSHPGPDQPAAGADAGRPAGGSGGGGATDPTSDGTAGAAAAAAAARPAAAVRRHRRQVRQRRPPGGATGNNNGCW